MNASSTAAGRNGHAGQQTRSQQQIDRGRQILGRVAFFLPEYVLTSEQSRVKWKRLLCEIGELFATLDCLSPPICSFCPVPLLNDCDQATLIILTGFLQFDEYVDGCAVLCAESDFKIGPL